MTDIQAALGLSQLRKLPDFIKKRKETASTYSRHFSSLGLRIPEFREGHIYFRYIIEQELSSVEKFLRKLRRAGINCKKPVFRPLHHYLGLKGFLNSEDAWQCSVSIPIYPSLTENEIKKIIESVRYLFVEK